MKLVRDLEQLPNELRGGAISIGNFDGVHRGHAQLVTRLLAQARSLGGPAIALSFDPHPAQLLRPDQAPPALTTTDQKALLLAEAGVDAVVAYPTTRQMLELTADEFFNRIVREQLGARGMVEGSNFCFGRNRTGTIDVLRQLTRSAGIELDVVEPVVFEGSPVSSSRIRKLLAEGQVDVAARLLGRAYQVQGQVVRGAARGARLGFPTANLAEVQTVLPAMGVYAGAANVAGQTWPAAIHLGPNATFGEDPVKLEIHLIGYQGDLYGQSLAVDFHRRLRETRKFDGMDALQQQLVADIAAASVLVPPT